MKTADIRRLVHFDDDARTEVLIETERLWSQVVCLQGPQSFGPVADDQADGMLTVLAGEVAVQVGSGRARMSQWGSVAVPAGAELHVRNASPEPAVVLLVVAPPPANAGSPND